MERHSEVFQDLTDRHAKGENGMADAMMVLLLAISGIIGYRLMDGIDGFIDQHVTGWDRPETENDADEYTEKGRERRTRAGMPVFLHIERKGHTRGV